MAKKKPWQKEDHALKPILDDLETKVKIVGFKIVRTKVGATHHVEISRGTNGKETQG